MMSFSLSNLPKRTKQPRQSGITMIMDKGLSYNEAENMLSVGKAHIDFVKLGFGTAVATPNLKQKIELYKKNNIKIYFGGTLFEAFYIRKQMNDYISICKDFSIDWVEISDGSIAISAEQKRKEIEKFAKHFNVLSEVGSKDAEKIIPPYKWIELMKNEINAGAKYVIAEAREAGNVGIYRASGEVRQGLVEEILTQIKSENIIWEAPNKDQQLFFLKLLGCNVNLGNIAPTEIIALESMRIGLRGDSFFFYLPQQKSKK